MVVGRFHGRSEIVVSLRRFEVAHGRFSSKEGSPKRKRGTTHYQLFPSLTRRVREGGRTTGFPLAYASGYQSAQLQNSDVRFGGLPSDLESGRFFVEADQLRSTTNKRIAVSRIVSRSA
jgi:hypothetical protein